MSALAHGLETLLDALADRIAERIRAHETALVSQSDRRGLGRRRHIDAVRRRMAEGRAGAYHIGDDYMLTPEAVREELERFGARDAPPAPAASKPTREPNARERREQAEQAEQAELDALGKRLEARLAAAATPPANTTTRSRR